MLQTGSTSLNEILTSSATSARRNRALEEAKCTRDRLEEKQEERERLEENIDFVKASIRPLEGQTG